MVGKEFLQANPDSCTEALLCRTNLMCAKLIDIHINSVKSYTEEDVEELKLSIKKQQKKKKEIHHM